MLANPHLSPSSPKTNSTLHSRALSARVATHNLRVVNESDGLGEEVKRLAGEISKAKAALPAGEWNGKNGTGGAAKEQRRKRRSSGGESDADDEEDDDEPPAAAPLAAAEAVLKGHGPGGDLRKLLKNGRPPRLLAALCGSRVSVVTPSRKAAIALKEEYHAFRDRGGVILTGELLEVFRLLRERERKRENGKKREEKNSLFLLLLPNLPKKPTSRAQSPPAPSSSASAAPTPAPRPGTASRSLLL